jgi:hypothetical protein
MFLCAANVAFRDLGGGVSVRQRPPAAEARATGPGVRQIRSPMALRIAMLLSATLVLSTGCGVSEDEVVRLKEGESLADTPYCGSLGCSDPFRFCAELFLEFGRSPPLCVVDNVCDRLECAKGGRRCAVFDGFPGQVKCID